MRFPMVQPVTEMTRSALGDRLAPGAVEYLDMFHDDAVFEFPFGTSGPVRVEGKAAMADYLASIEGSTVFERFDLTCSHPIRDDGMILRASYPAEESSSALLEYEGTVRNKRDGGTYRQSYFAVVKARGGRITLFREYWNPLPLVASFGPAGPLPI